MEKLTRQIHLVATKSQFESLKFEAEKQGTNVNSLIRSKLSLPPTPEEILVLRQLKKMFGRKNG